MDEGEGQHPCLCVPSLFYEVSDQVALLYVTGEKQSASFKGSDLPCITEQVSGLRGAKMLSLFTTHLTLSYVRLSPISQMDNLIEYITQQCPYCNGVSLYLKSNVK